MPTMPPPIGLPGELSISFDPVMLVWSFTVVVMLAGLALLLWAVRARDRVVYRLRCPEHRTEATVVVRMPRGKDAVEIESCSLCTPPTRVECDKRCARLVA